MVSRTVDSLSSAVSDALLPQVKVKELDHVRPPMEKPLAFFKTPTL